MMLQVSIKLRSVRTWPAAETKTPVPYSTLRRITVPSGITPALPPNGTKALDIATTIGSIVPSIAWS